jgi:hypothetical protein
VCDNFFWRFGVRGQAIARPRFGISLTSDSAAVKKSKSPYCRRGLRLVGRIKSGVASLRSLPHALQKDAISYLATFSTLPEKIVAHRSREIFILNLYKTTN